VAAALQALRLMAGKGRLCAVFQPHLYSRTRQLTAEFARAFLACDLLFVLPVYAAREEPIPGVEGNVLTEAASGLGHAAAHFLAQRSAVAREVARALRAGDVCATLGAGDVGDLAPQILEALG
jgi:UDP-N-acetylmuramate--alanine ligase